MTAVARTARFRITAFIAGEASGSDISVPGSGSGYDEDLARSLAAIVPHGGQADLTRAGLLDLAEWLGAMEIGNSESGNQAGATSCRKTAQRARSVAESLREPEEAQPPRMVTLPLEAREVVVGDLIGKTKHDVAPRKVLEVRDHSIARSLFLARTDEEKQRVLDYNAQQVERRHRPAGHVPRGRELDSIRIQPRFTTRLWVTRPDQTVTTNHSEEETMAEQTQEQKDAAAKKAADEKAAKAKAAEEAKAAKADAAAVKKAAAEKAKAEAKEKRDAERAEKKAAAEAEKKARAEERANRPKKVPLTLSQRRGILALAKGAATPKTTQAAKPLEYFVTHGLATKSGTGDKTKYTITAAGKERAKEVNPKYAAAA